MTLPWIDPELNLTGRHITLLPLEISQVPDLFRAGNDADLWRFVPDVIRSEADMAAYVETALGNRRKGEAFPFATVTADSGKILGSTRFYALSRHHRNLEIGYTWLTKPAWRTAVNTEAKFLMLRYAFETLGCIRVGLRTDARNLRSQRAMERFGAVREGVFRKHMIMPDGYIRDSVYYSVTDGEWPQVKAFLTRAMERPIA